MAKTSFLPEDFLEQRKQRRTNVISLVLFVIVMSAIVGAFFVTNQQRAEVRHVQDQVNMQFEEAARLIEQFDDLQARRESMIRKAKVTAVLLERVPRSFILAELINTMPPRLSLVEFTLDTKVLAAGAAPATAMQRARQTLQNQPAADPAGPNPANDMPELRPTEVTIKLVGLAPTDVDVSQYMASLARSGMISDVSLQYTREEEIDKISMRRFLVNLVVDQDVDLATIEPKMVERSLKQNPMDDLVEFGVETDPAIANPPHDRSAFVPVGD